MSLADFPRLPDNGFLLIVHPPARRLAGKLHQGLEYARLLLGPENQVAVVSLGRFLKPREAVGLDGDGSRRRKSK